VVRLPFYAICQDIGSRLGIDQPEAYSTSALACKKVDHVAINRAR